MRKAVVLTLLMLLVCSFAFATGSTEAVSQERVVTTTCRASYATEEWYNNMNAAFTAETGIKVVVEPTPGNDDDHNTKVITDLIAGGTIDVIETLGPRDQKSRVDAGFFAPLSELCEKNGIDYKALWGENLTIEEDGDFYGIPFKNEIYVCYYNKKIFDQAGVPYPKAPWTWADYVETAKKLTVASDGVFGSYMSNANPYEMMFCMQENVPYYKEDGTSNFDDPRFAAAIQWYKDLGTQGVQPSMAYIKANNVSWNYYAIQDNLGLFVQGNWFMRLLNSQADYPRDWEYGVVAMPSTSSAEGNNLLVSSGYVAVNKNAEHPTEAIIYAAWIGQNQWKFEGGLPALATLTQEEQESCFAATADASNGQTTVAELYDAMYNTGMGSFQSDMIGPGASEYDAIVREEVEKFCLDQQDLNTTIDRIVKRANEAIASAN